MIIKSVNLETVCGITSTLPDNDKIEIAFAGKSNVGKSSFINSLINRKSLARTSSTPGKTQTINFYNVNEELYFVDLPGYGYAKAPENVKKKWAEMIERYLNKSNQLKAVFLLIDIRHEPNQNDINMYNWIVYNGHHPVIIATKLDKIKRSQREKQIKLIRESLKTEAETKIIPFSSVTKEGREQTWDYIESAINYSSNNTDNK
ncbi:MAG TPA: YihA family ribosome biogenesis GTP-binding protein [Clostridiales bacterium]|nr:YihA family ribosome biogenesis GTP-binding protein [Clostridiales bacterium]